MAPLFCHLRSDSLPRPLATSDLFPARPAPPRLPGSAHPARPERIRRVGGCPTARISTDGPAPRVLPELLIGWHPVGSFACRLPLGEPEESSEGRSSRKASCKVSLGGRGGGKHRQAGRQPPPPFWVALGFFSFLDESEIDSGSLLGKGLSAFRRLRTLSCSS